MTDQLSATRLTPEQQQRCESWAHHPPSRIMTEQERLLSGYLLDAVDHIAALEQRVRVAEQELARMREHYALAMEASRNIVPSAYYEFNQYLVKRGEAINAKYDALAAQAGEGTLGVGGEERSQSQSGLQASATPPSTPPASEGEEAR